MVSLKTKFEGGFVDRWAQPMLRCLINTATVTTALYIFTYDVTPARIGRTKSPIIAVSVNKARSTIEVGHLLSDAVAYSNRLEEIIVP